MKGIGGGIETAADLALVPIYLRSGHVILRLSAACFVFRTLGCKVLLGNDTLVREKATIAFTSKNPYVRFGSCEDQEVPIRVSRHAEISKVVVRAKERVSVPAYSARVVEIRMSAPLEAGQDYHFDPRPHLTQETGARPIGRGLTRGVFAHDQEKVLFTNFSDTELTIYKGTTIGYASSLPPTAPHVLWMEAAEELESFWGLLGKDPEAASGPAEHRSAGEPRREWPTAPVVTDEEGVAAAGPALHRANQERVRLEDLLGG